VPLSASTPLLLAISYIFLMIDNNTALAEGGANMKERKQNKRDYANTVTQRHPLRLKIHRCRTKYSSNANFFENNPSTVTSLLNLNYHKSNIECEISLFIIKIDDMHMHTSQIGILVVNVGGEKKQHCTFCMM
jgi:hypothetical protein